MKEFEKWSKKYYPDNVAVFYCNQKEGWKAALKWMLSCDTGPEADELIVKELEDVQV